MKENNYRYSLEPCGNGRQYHVCPQCGHKRFTLYIDNETGEPIADDCGRCERSHNCDYHNPPKDYFQQLKKNNMKNENEPKEVVSAIDPTRIENKSSMLSGEKDFPNGALTFLFIRLFGEKAIEVLKLYRVMIAKQYYKDGKYGVAFLQIDRKGNIRQVKIMAYNPKTGKRLKENDEFLNYNRRSRRYEKRQPDTSASIYLGKRLMYDKEFVNKQCLFGTQLLGVFPDKPVAIVESEKTALICAIEMPEYIWLATGGQHGCKWTSPEVYNDLRGRKVILFPDLNATEDWRIRSEDLAMDGIDISVYEGLEEMATAEEREQGWDIADYVLMKIKQEKPELFNIKIEISTSEAKKVDAPAVTNLFKDLNRSKLNQGFMSDNLKLVEELMEITPTDEDVAELANPPKKETQLDNSSKELELDKLWEEDDEALSDIK